jgi:hypothetical protein
VTDVSLSHREVVEEMIQSAIDEAVNQGLSNDEIRSILESFLDDDLTEQGPDEDEQEFAAASEAYGYEKCAHLHHKDCTKECPCVDPTVASSSGKMIIDKEVILLPENFKFAKDPDHG